MSFLFLRTSLFSRSLTSAIAPSPFLSLYRAFSGTPAFDMASSKLFVGGLAWATTDDSLRSKFEQYGEVTEARVVTDRESGRSKGFGFVTYASTESAEAAVKELNEKDLDGRNIRVDFATDKGSAPRREFGGRGGGRGGFDRGGYGDRDRSYGGRGDRSGYSNDRGYGSGDREGGDRSSRRDDYRRSDRGDRSERSGGYGNGGY